MNRELNGRTVLLVENDLTMAEVIGIVLESAGAELLGPCPSVDTCLALLATVRPDVALLDLQLDDGDVYPVALALKDRNVPYAFFTGAPHLLLPEFRDSVVLPKPSGSSAVVATLVALLA